mgnify:FL=1
MVIKQKTSWIHHTPPQLNTNPTRPKSQPNPRRFTNKTRMEDGSRCKGRNFQHVNIAQQLINVFQSEKLLPLGFFSSGWGLIRPKDEVFSLLLSLLWFSAEVLLTAHPRSFFCSLSYLSLFLLPVSFSPITVPFWFQIFPPTLALCALFLPWKPLSKTLA